MMINLIIDGKPVKAKKGLTILEAAKKHKIQIENLCASKAKDHKPVCRICSVYVDGINGLIPSCSTIIEEGMVITTTNEEIEDIRDEIFDMMLSETEIGNGVFSVEVAPKLNRSKDHAGYSDGFRAKEVSGEVIAKFKSLENDFIGLDPSKCIHCDRCVVSCPNDIISRACRGADVVYNFGNNQTLNQSGCTSCGDCVRACPSGAIYEK